MKTAFDQSVCDCDHQGADYKLTAGDDLATILSNIIQEIWRKKGMPALNKKLVSFYGDQFTKAVEQGYGKKIGDIDYDTPDGNMLAHLVNNVYQFSAAKTYTQLRQLTQALIGEDGKLRTESQFKKAAYEINDTHVNQWLKAERELAIAGSQMASKWIDITENNATRFVEFDVVLDGHTSEICRPLHRLVVSVDDPMLHIYYPPNHFGCRTTVRQRFNGPSTPESKREYPEIPPMFRVNLAQQKLVFPAGHAYWIDTPAAVLKEALSMAPLNTWVLVENNTIRIHSKVNASASDFTQVMEVARDYAAKGQKVDILPALDHLSDPLYKTLFKGAKAGKCPDLIVNGKIYAEVKTPKKIGLNTLKHSISQASSQADNVVILLPGKADINLLNRVAKGRFLDHPNLQVIEFKMQGDYYRMARKDFIK